MTPGSSLGGGGFIKAIETVYLGYRMRSRLEARYAVMLTTLGVQWVYEPQGFVLGSGPYLPDFFLTRHGVYLECKPVPPTGEDRAKLKELATLTGHESYFLVGQPGDQATISATEDTPHSLNLCSCGELLFLRAETPYRRSALCVGCGELKKFPWPGFLRAGLSRAYSAARSARFGEHGEYSQLP